MSAKPALSPSLNPSTSKAKVAVTLGNFVFLTTNTCKPFAKVNLTGLATCIKGAFAGAGDLVLSNVCAIVKKGKHNKTLYIYFFIKLFFDSLNSLTYLVVFSFGK